MGDLSEKQYDFFNYTYCTYKFPKFCCRYTFEEIETIAKYLKNKIKIVPKVGIICGSGLGKLFFLIQKCYYLHKFHLSLRMF
jgi:hypothetical protein